MNKNSERARHENNLNLLRKTIYNLQGTADYKLFGLMHDDRKPLTDDAWITI